MRFTKRAEAGLCSPMLVITAARALLVFAEKTKRQHRSSFVGPAAGYNCLVFILFVGSYGSYAPTPRYMARQGNQA
ncbi:hypothetical protein B0H14DRAFT_2971086 [Mycena olivaceomarginata]|nr:hypothetical protein B0H14DRAFT_2971086 [Mycena olivaceomarginata]